MSDEALTLLRSIAADMRELVTIAKARRASTEPTVDLDSQHGDPVVKAKDPRDWAGDSMQARKFSECPPEYLDLLAARYDYFAEREADAKKKKYNQLDAARARGWAARLRNGWTPPTLSPESQMDAMVNSEDFKW